MEKMEAIIENPCNSADSADFAPDLPPEMMEQILQYLPLEDLYSCRLVWKDHDDITKEAIGKKLKPILFNVKTKEIRDHLKNNPNSPVPDELQLKLTLEEDHETIKEICENLRGKIKHLKIDMDRNYVKDHREIEEFIVPSQHSTQRVNAANACLAVHILEIFGDSLETLEFRLFKLRFYKIANPMAQKSSAAGNFTFPELKKITISGAPPTGKLSSEIVSIWNRLIFKSCEKLKSIQLKYCEGAKHIKWNWDVRANVLKDLEEVGRLTQITSLGLFGFLDRGSNLDTLLKYESCGGLQIEELYIEETGRKENLGKLERVLKMQSKKLKIFSVIDYCLEDIEIPVMERLTSLKLLADYYHLRKNICFATITPNLKSLEVRRTDGKYEFEYENDKWMKVLFESTEPCKSLETLKIIPPKGYSHLPLEVWVCEMLARNFPSITSLTLSNPGEEFLQRLWTTWPNLRNLNLALGRGSKDWDLDQSLFGITPEWKRSVDKEVDQWWTLYEPPLETQMQSVCNLEKLQVLRIYRDVTPFSFWRHGGEQRRPENCPIHSNFSELSFFYGLKNMRNLQLFSMNQGSEVSHEREISAEARHFIRSELPSLRIHCKLEKPRAKGTVENFFGV